MLLRAANTALEGSRTCNRSDLSLNSGLFEKLLSPVAPVVELLDHVLLPLEALTQLVEATDKSELLYVRQAVKITEGRNDDLVVRLRGFHRKISRVEVEG